MEDRDGPPYQKTKSTFEPLSPKMIDLRNLCDFSRELLVVLIEVTYIIDSIDYHGDTFDTHAECES